ncbi:methyl-accepting chemotaxis sensory transducer [Lutibaculum baratangense AMV1]|uniref:Methyl-accepting chemotaxis sensory transducer n=1 Tax=Lutibaculum baratangense AMV1 TaxID=631454 RepID=V4RG87_9HYPH|nr:methyl-accepting chemotaxis sensory transducer [Lutibaculum baratangense AMV1]
MDQVTQQNAAMVEQTTAASHNLSGEAKELERLVARFTLGGGADAPSAPAPARKARPQAARQSYKTAGNAALKAAPIEESWEEF